jgi:hypothetical protein
MLLRRLASSGGRVIAALACIGLWPVLPAAGAPTQAVKGPLQEAGPDGQAFVGYVDSTALPQVGFERWPGVEVQQLSADPASGRFVTRFDPARWQPASLARAAGATIDLRVMHLKKDPFTTARTWYVRLGAGMKMPWEVHSMVEEGFLIEGAYQLAECLPTRTVLGRYAAGGYFWRPGGIPHSGPESGPEGAVIWLQRSPVALDVSLFEKCGGGQASAPVVAK